MSNIRIRDCDRFFEYGGFVKILCAQRNLKFIYPRRQQHLHISQFSALPRTKRLTESEAILLMGSGVVERIKRIGRPSETGLKIFRFPQEDERSEDTISL